MDYYDNSILKYRKLIYCKEKDIYICRYIYRNNIIDYHIKNDKKTFINVFNYWKNEENKIKNERKKYINFMLLML